MINFADSLEMMSNSQERQGWGDSTDGSIMISIPGSQSQDESGELKDHLDISQHEADKNFSDIGGLVKEEEPTLTMEILRAKYPEAFTSTSEAALAEVLAEANLGHSLSAFQETAVNGMLNGQDVVCIVPTGAGKMLVLGCFKISRIPIN